MASNLRIRCNYCDRRIPSTAILCPFCRHNPRGFYWKPRAVLIAMVLGAVVLAACGLFLTSLNLSMPTIALVAPASTATDTREPIRIIVTATSPPSTATVRPTQAPTSAPIPTATAVLPTAGPSAPVTATLTPTLVSSSPTAITVAPTEPPSATATIPAIPAPALISPANGERFTGPSKIITFDFALNRQLKPEEWARLQVDYLDTAGHTSSWCAFVKAPGAVFPREEGLEKSSIDSREFKWHVAIVEAAATATSDCNLPFKVISAPGEVRSFFWF